MRPLPPSGVIDMSLMWKHLQSRPPPCPAPRALAGWGLSRRATWRRRRSQRSRAAAAAVAREDDARAVRRPDDRRGRRARRMTNRHRPRAGRQALRFAGVRGHHPQMRRRHGLRHRVVGVERDFERSVPSLEARLLLDLILRCECDRLRVGRPRELLHATGTVRQLFRRAAGLRSGDE